MIRLALTAVLLVGCVPGPSAETGKTDAQEAVEALGFTAYQELGRALARCSKDDSYCVGWRAKNPAGQTVEGFAGCGWFLKGCTVRGMKVVKQ